MISLDFISRFFENPSLLIWAIPLLLVLFIFIKINFSQDHKDKRDILKKRRRTFFITRSLILLCILIALASPFVLRERLIKGDYALTLITDNSTSFQIFDASLASRMENQLSNYIKVNTHTIGDDSQTPLSDAILAQLQEKKNILLITDGYNNVGPDLSSTLLQATKTNSSINAISLTPQKQDTSLTLIGPDKVSAGIKNLFTAHIQGTISNAPKHLMVTVDGIKILDKQTTEREIPFYQTFTEGSHHVTAQLEGTDYFSENNVYYKTVKVIPKPRILFVSEKESPLFSLLQQLYNVDKSPNLNSLNGDIYYATIINDLPFSSLEPGLPKLKEYLSDDNGVLFIGGENSLDKGGYQKTLAEELLPAIIAVPDEKDEGIVNIVISMDISKSTGQGYGTGSVSQVEKAIALSVLENIKDTSQVGFIGFDSKSHIISEISPLGDKREDVMQKVRSLTKQSSDSYVPTGLESAISMLRGVSGGKNIIFISDGKSGGIGYAKSLAAAAQQQNIKIYGVGVGDRNECVRYNARGDCVIQPSDIYGVDAIKNIALAGGGAYFTGDKTPQKVKVLFGGGEHPQDKDSYAATVIDEGHFITQDLNLNAQVTGFNTVIPKNTASDLVSTDTGEPLLTVWRYGVGRVGLLSTDDGTVWGKELLGGENSLIYTKTLNWLIGDPERKSDYYVSIQDTNLKRDTEIIVKSKEQPVAEGLTFYKRDNDLYSVILTPAQTGFQKVLGTEFAVNYNKELEGIGFNPELESLAKSTNGQIFDESQIEDIVAAVKTHTEQPLFKRWYLRWPFILLAVIIFLFEIYLRRAAR